MTITRISVRSFNAFHPQILPQKNHPFMGGFSYSPGGVISKLERLTQR
jgi:hypothetical protein